MACKVNGSVLNGGLFVDAIGLFEPVKILRSLFGSSGCLKLKLLKMKLLEVKLLEVKLLEVVRSVRLVRMSGKGLLN